MLLSVSTISFLYHHYHKFLWVIDILKLYHPWLMASMVCIMKCGDKDIKTLLFSPPPSFPFVSFTPQEHSLYRWLDKYASGLHICVAQFHITAGRTGVCQILFKLVNCGFVCFSGKNYCAYETVFRSFHFVVIWYNKLFSCYWSWKHDSYKDITEAPNQNCHVEALCSVG